MIVVDELAIICQIARYTAEIVVQRFEDQYGQLKLNAMTKRQPMKLTENWGDVVTPRSADDQTCDGVLDCLQPSHQAIGDSEQEAVAVVQP